MQQPDDPGKSGADLSRRAISGVPAFDLVNLPGLMALTEGRPEIAVGLIDGPVTWDHPELATERIRELPGALGCACSRADSAACRHGTFVAGILSARRGSAAPAICPGCTLLVRPIFSEGGAAGEPPGAAPDSLAQAILDCVCAGARVLNISAAITQPLARTGGALVDALRDAARRGTIVVVAAGNQATLGGTAITADPWVSPVVACDAAGRPLAQSNLGASIGRRGLAAPGDRIVSLGTSGRPLVSGGTSAAAAFVSGALALLWSLFPGESAAAIKLSVTSGGGRRTTVVPPLLDAWAAYLSLTARLKEGEAA